MSPPLPLRLLPEVRDEFDAAVDWYEQQRPGLGTAFLDRVREVFARVAANPQLHATVYQDVPKRWFRSSRMWCSTRRRLAR
jgi:plasmid stabilization system protein ParE